MKTTLLVLLLTIGLGTAFATSTTSELVIENSNGSQICSITENAGGNAVYTGNACSGLTGRVLFNDSSITISNGTFITGGTNTWALSVVDGVSGTPDADGPGLDVTSLTAVCGSVGNPCSSGSQMQLLFSDTGFTTPAGSFVNGFSATDSGSSTAQTEHLAFVSTTNTLLAQTTSIGTVGWFTGAGTFNGSVSGGAAATTPYSLTLEQVFTTGSTDTTKDTFSVDGSLNANPVPEPMSLLLLGGCLLVVGRKLTARLA